MLEAALTAPLAPDPAALSTALCISSTSSLTSPESWSIASFASWPASVSGLPRPFRSPDSVLVADLILSVVSLMSPSERFPPWSDCPAVLTESDQFVIALQRSCAQSSAEGDELLEPPPPPQPAASTTASASGARASLIAHPSAPAGPRITLCGRKRLKR